MFWLVGLGFSQAEIVITEIDPANNRVELENIGDAAQNIGTYRLCSFPVYTTISGMTFEEGSMMMQPGDIVVITGHSMNVADDELGLYINNSWSNPASILDYVEWGNSNHQRDGVAESAGIWFDGAFVAAPGAGESISWNGSSEEAGAWSLGTPTFGTSNIEGGGPTAGTISTEDATTICAGNGVPDPITVTVEGASGETETWIVTDESGEILAITDSNVFDFDEAGAGVCTIWHLVYNGVLIGLEEENSVDDFNGDFALSNPIDVTRDVILGGTISTEDNLFACVGDGNPDEIVFSVTGNTGANSTWVVTDEAGNIVGIPGISNIDFEGAGDGICLVWHLAYNDIEGVMMGANAADLTGCFALSNPIEVVRTEVQGGTISTEDATETCPGDGEDDFVDVTLEEEFGTNSQWVITDEAGVILELPLGPPFNFEGAGEGVCLIWHLSFEDGLTGAEVGMNASDLEGCYSLSNAITITRETPEGGMISTDDPIEICAGDGEEDPITVTLEGNAGANSAWVVTNEALDILDITDSNVFDFDGAGAGVCLIWHLSYNSIEGAEVGLNAGDLTGCFSLSNSISVVRTGVAGGTISTEDPTDICAGDEIGDPINVTLEGAEGTNSAWVITDEAGMILGLPAGPPFDLDEAGPGTCLIWHLSFEDGLVGAEEGLNANDLEGCYSLSNPIAVNRYEPDAGMISTTDETTICVGDGESDSITVDATEGEGPNFAWVITDENGLILGLPESNEIDLEGAGPGICLIWRLAFWEVEGAEVDMNANDLTGCFSLSNPIEVTRVFVDGGSVTTDADEDEITVIVGDGMADEITFSNDSESDESYMYIITEEDGTILGVAESSNDFEGAPVGVCLVYGVSYTETLDAEAGDNVADVSSDGCFDISDEWLVVNREVVDNVNENDALGVNLFPSVSNGLVTINNVDQNLTVEVYENTGRLVVQETINAESSELDLTHLPVGQYVVRFVTNDALKSTRIAIVR